MQGRRAGLTTSVFRTDQSVVTDCWAVQTGLTSEICLLTKHKWVNKRECHVPGSIRVWVKVNNEAKMRQCLLSLNNVCFPQGKIPVNYYGKSWFPHGNSSKWEVNHN